MGMSYLRKLNALSDLFNFPNASGIGVFGGGLFVNIDGTPRLIGPATVGKTFYVDAVNGSASNDGRSPGKAFSTLALAYAACTAGQNDTVVILSNGATTGTIRVDAAFTWAKNATHLVGLGAGSMSSQRARIAPTSSTTAFTSFFTISGAGCRFENVQFYHGFATGAAAMLAMTITGHYNAFSNVHFAGMGDTASANSATSRSLLIQASENYFKNCTIGLATQARTAANASLEFGKNPTTGFGSAQNVFEDCIFPAYGTGSGTGLINIYSAGSNSMDRFNYFRRCLFANPSTLAGGVLQAAVATLAAACGGALWMDNCSRGIVTDWGTDATTLAQMIVNGPGTGGTAGDDVGRGTPAVGS